jgi:hypothetical protein
MSEQSIPEYVWPRVSLRTLAPREAARVKYAMLGDPRTHSQIRLPKFFQPVSSMLSTFSWARACLISSQQDSRAWETSS